jgi:hypothetical protein
MKARDNPFGAGRVHKLDFRLRGISWETLMKRLANLNYRAALVGPHGAGKTTLVRAMEPGLIEKGFVIKRLRLTEDQPAFDGEFIRSFFRGLRCCDMVLLDGAEQMDWMTWNLFRWRCRVAGGLIITTHRPGRLPMLYRCETDEALLIDLLGELLSAPVTMKMRREAAHLFELYRGNIREVCRDLYDQFAVNR